MRGSLKGWAAEVDVAAGLSFGRGWVGSGVTGWAERRGVLWERERVEGRAFWRLVKRRRQRWQIMLNTYCGMVDVELGVEGSWMHLTNEVSEETAEVLLGQPPYAQSRVATNIERLQCFSEHLIMEW